MKGACLISVLVMIACLAETRAYVSFDQVNPDNSSVSPDDLKKAAAGTEKPKLIRVPLERRSRRAIDGSLATINENDGEKPGRATITERPVPEDVAPDARQGAKRKHKKLKLSQTQGRKKSKKTKRYIGNAARQQLTNGNQNRSETVSFDSHRDERYYAQRKAILDRFHARNREIARKYRDPASTITTTTEGPFRYTLGFGGLNTATENHRSRLRTTVQPPRFTPPPRVLASTKPSTMPTMHILQGKRKALLDDDDAGGYDDSPENDSEDEMDDLVTNEQKPDRGDATTTEPTTTIQPAQPEHHNNQSMGKCKPFESLNMLYQHNLVLDSKKGMSATAEIFMPTEEGNCVVCIVANNKAGKWQKDTDLKTAILKVKGELNAQVSISLQFYTAPANGLPCLDVRSIRCEIFT
ncbi:uncharacterized protein LOC143362694 [Halictus rubicundus]|uniref:uncharacterized protein LOC143362694 n=1 Tax=Halictus rubicundus TaxID=77578 RepID=UPI0040362790